MSSLHEDDAYPSRYKKSYGKPKLIENMRKFSKSVSGLLQSMFVLGRGEEVKLSKKQLEVLERIGIDNISNLPGALKWMSTKDGASISTFSYCIFDEKYPYASDVYARLLGESSFKRLENHLLSNGYKQYNIYKLIASTCNLSLSIVNPKWSEESPRGGNEYKIKHTGISAQYDDYTINPVLLGLCIPNGMKAYLEKFDSIDDDLQGFIAERTKKCDNCRYCVQTDKSGSRPLAHTVIRYNGSEYKLCNYFPGYNYSWSSIDDDLVDKLLKMLAFMDSFISKKLWSL